MGECSARGEKRKSDDVIFAGRKSLRTFGGTSITELETTPEGLELYESLLGLYDTMFPWEVRGALGKDKEKVLLPVTDTCAAAGVYIGDPFPIRCVRADCLNAIAPWSYNYCGYHASRCCIQGCSRESVGGYCFWEKPRSANMFQLYRRCSSMRPACLEFCTCRMIPVCPTHLRVELSTYIRTRLVFDPDDDEERRKFTVNILKFAFDVVNSIDIVYDKHNKR